MNQNLCYWLISAPETGKDHAFDLLQSTVSKSENLATCSKFHVPELRVGTMDALMSLSDDLIRVDNYVEGVTRKISQQLYSLLKSQDRTQNILNVNSGTPESFLSAFRWDEAKYPIKSSCREISDTINSSVLRLDEELRSKVLEYSSLNQTLSAEERKTSGNLMTRDLTDIVRSEHSSDSEYLITLFVVVQKYVMNEWLACYETLAPFVVPRSSQKIHEDNEYVLFNVVVFRKHAEEFKTKSRERRYIVRDFRFDENQIVQGKENKDKLAKDKKNAKKKLILWCRTNFQEAFIGWIHVKAIRAFVESILRYGLGKFQAMLILANKKDDKRLRQALNNLYKHLGSRFLDEEESGSNEGFYPYVYLPINLESIAPQQ
eukprot:TRINITY_DN303_c0_g6_i1.p1 TRINITY_DN303_c0_g6~~TRINITY_DN303_c0_g6_i1.p1  ORF type:complete len:375 (-),score=156.41 TRINITY_DN303_c0_g6_i1:173-1297(-)